MRKTVFIRAIEAAVDQKATVVREATRGSYPARYELDSVSFASIPKSPFGYWVSKILRDQFKTNPPLESQGREVCSGATTNDDSRFLRLWFEVPARDVARSREETSSLRWCPLAKGGEHATYYSDIYLLVDWWRDGKTVKAHISDYRGRRGWGFLWSAALNGHEHYFRPGLTWSRRSQKGLSLRALPAGGLFGDKGPVVLAVDDNHRELLILLAILNSRAFRELVQAQMAFGSYEVGVLERTPIPASFVLQACGLDLLARRAWSLKRYLDTCIESSHAFALPALLQVAGNSLIDRAKSWEQRTGAGERELDTLVAEIDNHVFRLYDISNDDRQLIEQGFDGPGQPEDPSEEEDSDNSDEDATEIGFMVASLLSWSLGAAFGRFDVRLVTGQRTAPIEPEPFDPLPVCSPGMLTSDDGLPVEAHPEGYQLNFPTDGILVDDPGHTRDLIGAAWSVFDAVFHDADACWHEATQLLGVSDLRTWYVSHFFDLHIKRYSKSRRKAPIYWQLATASASYSVWIYIHRATGDTLFQILESDVLGGKLDHEKSKLNSLTQGAGANPSAAARREIELQENFVGELNALRTEIARVAPLWKPNLDDGVILNFAPLWRLVPQSKSWQAECKKAWDKLVSGEYDWAHIAMHLWPERVVLKCIDDRSLAIAHSLEEVLWHEDASGTWQKQQVDETTVQKLIDERTSATVKAALRDLLSAATPAVSKGRKPKAKSSSPQSAAPKSVPTVARAPAAEAIVDEATLNAVKATIARVASGASKADVLTATGLSDADWNKAVAVLLERGDVVRSGQKRGTRYHVGTHGENR